MLIKNFFLTLVVFLGIDSVWLGLIAKNFYQKELSSFNRTFNIPAALLAYITLAFAISYFVIPKAEGNTVKALLNGALLGLIVYATYDLTNLATLADFTLKMAVVDIVWGITITALVSFLVAYIGSLI
jgi:uncharacterized membrane protein